MLYTPVAVVETATGVAPAIMEEGEKVSLQEYLQSFMRAVQKDISGGVHIDNVHHETWYVSPHDLEFLDMLYSYNDSV